MATVDVDEASDLSDAFHVTAVPHFIFLKGGAQVCQRRQVEACLRVAAGLVPGAGQGFRQEVYAGSVVAEAWVVDARSRLSPVF